MLKRLSFQHRLFISLSILIIIMVAILSSVFYTYSANNFLNTEFESSRQKVKTVTSQMDELFKQMDIAASNTVSNAELQNILYELNYNPKITDADMLSYDSTVRTILQQIYTYLPKATKTAVFNSKKHFYFYAGIYDYRPDVINRRIHDEAWYESLIEPGNNTAIRHPHISDWSDKRNVVISLYKRFTTLSDTEYGIFEIQIPYEILDNICKIDSSPANSQRIIVYNKQGKILFPFGEDKYSLDRDGFEPKMIFEQTKSGTEGTGRIKGNRGYLLYSFQESEYTGWIVALSGKETVLAGQVRFYRNITIVFGVSILLIMLLAFFLLTRSMTKPLKQLITTVERVNLENLNLPVPEGEIDEFKMLDESFQTMFSNLKDSINKLYESKIKEADAHFLALQAQMNPHFLYNSLNAISAAGEQYGSETTTAMCNQLADMLRYTTTPSNKFVSLKEEINHAVNYLELMKVPYEGSLNYEVYIPDRLYMVDIPKLTLQPLVENSINHGLEKVLPPWNITICGKITDSFWEISIEDNGTGFDEAILDKIQKQSLDYKSNLTDGNFKANLAIGGMGILNIYARMAIQFGGKTIFRIENLSPKGCKVTFGRMLEKGEAL